MASENKTFNMIFPPMSQLSQQVAQQVPLPATQQSPIMSGRHSVSGPPRQRTSTSRQSQRRLSSADSPDWCMEELLGAETRIDLNHTATGDHDVGRDVTGATTSGQGHGYHLRTAKCPPDRLSPSTWQKWTRKGKDAVNQVTSKFGKKK
ncbi:hypothetical protein PIB30_064420 [Stylosanthes scabra]|uniref:Uncharacterized protein n=1 Tax=Stylosanthes scabra TaxID=79078 RepID=A0ABU6YL52_9FABA|nr:hypothetical protein [Stylosanthes scabra]